MSGSVNRFCALLMLWATPALAVSAGAALVSQTQGDSLVLEDGREVRLAAVRLPAEGEPLSGDSRQALDRLVRGKPVALSTVKDSPDRRGRIVAFVAGEGGAGVGEALLAEGMAMVDVTPDVAGRAGKLLEIERLAREQKRGIWANPYFSVVDEQDAMERRDRFGVVEGTIRKVEERKDATYLNFGDDWKTDFTLTINRDDRTKYFKGFDFPSLEGKRVRARGWVYSKNGPMIDLRCPQQLEALTASARPASPSR